MTNNAVGDMVSMQEPALSSRRLPITIVIKIYPAIPGLVKIVDVYDDHIPLSQAV